MTKDQILDQLKIPLVAAPLFIISQKELVLACCKNGVLGTFPALNNRSTEGLEQWIIEIKEELKQFEADTGKKAAPFGVNLIVHRTNPRLQADLEVIKRQEVPIIITSLGAVPDLVETVHSYGGLVFHDVINTRHAQKAIDAGVDGLILVCAGAGGHAGMHNPIPFVTEIRQMFDGIILLSGAMSSGRDIATALQMGADFAYMGTRFINTDEAIASEDYQNMIIESGTSDIVYTAAVSGVNGNYLRQSLEAAGLTKDLWATKAKIDFGKLEVGKESKAWKNLWGAGESAATIKDSLPVGALIKRMEGEFKAALREQAALLERY